MSGVAETECTLIITAHGEALATNMGRVIRLESVA